MNHFLRTIFEIIGALPLIAMCLLIFLGLVLCVIITLFNTCSSLVDFKKDYSYISVLKNKKALFIVISFFLIVLSSFVLISNKFINEPSIGIYILFFLASFIITVLTLHKTNILIAEYLKSITKVTFILDLVLIIMAILMYLGLSSTYIINAILIIFSCFVLLAIVVFFIIISQKISHVSESIGEDIHDFYIRFKKNEDLIDFIKMTLFYISVYLVVRLIDTPVLDTVFFMFSVVPAFGFSFFSIDVIKGIFKIKSEAILVFTQVLMFILPMFFLYDSFHDFKFCDKYIFSIFDSDDKKPAEEPYYVIVTKKGNVTECNI